MRALGICLLVIGLVGFGLIGLGIFNEMLIVGFFAWPILLAMIIIGAILIIASLGGEEQTGSENSDESDKLNDKPGDEL